MRRRILTVLEREGHGCTVDYLLQEIRTLAVSPTQNMVDELNAMEQERLVYLHRDSSAGRRLTAPHGIALVCLRGDV